MGNCEINKTYLLNDQNQPAELDALELGDTIMLRNLRAAIMKKYAIEKLETQGFSCDQTPETYTEKWLCVTRVCLTESPRAPDEHTSMRKRMQNKLV